MPMYPRFAPGLVARVPMSTAPVVGSGDTCGSLRAAPDMGVEALPEPWRTSVLKALSVAVDPVRLEALAVQLDGCGQHQAALQVRNAKYPAGDPITLLPMPCEGFARMFVEDSPDARNGTALANEDLRRMRTGAAVYMPNWVSTAGIAYFSAYQAAICNGGGQFFQEGLNRWRIVERRGITEMR